jgi:hypothetical protein
MSDSDDWEKQADNEEELEKSLQQADKKKAAF